MKQPCILEIIWLTFFMKSIFWTGMFLCCAPNDFLVIYFLKGNRKEVLEEVSFYFIFLFPSKITLFRPPTLEGMTCGAWPKCCSKCSPLQVEQVEARISWGQKKKPLSFRQCWVKADVWKAVFIWEKKTCFSCLILCKSRKSKSDDIIISWWLRIK